MPPLSLKNISVDLQEIKTLNIPYLEFNRSVGYKDNYIIRSFEVLDEYKIKLVTPDIPVFAWKPMLFMIGTVGAMYLWKYLHTL